MYKLRDNLIFEGLDTTPAETQIYLNGKPVGLGTCKRVLLGLGNVSIDEALQSAAKEIITSHELSTSEMPVVVSVAYGASIELDGKDIKEQQRKQGIRQLSNNANFEGDNYIGLIFGEYDNGDSICHTIVRFGQYGIEVLVTPKSETKYIQPFINGEIVDIKSVKTLKVHTKGGDILEEKLS